MQVAPLPRVCLHGLFSVQQILDCFDHVFYLVIGQFGGDGQVDYLAREHFGGGQSLAVGKGVGVDLVAINGGA